MYLMQFCKYYKFISPSFYTTVIKCTTFCNYVTSMVCLASIGCTSMWYILPKCLCMIDDYLKFNLAICTCDVAKYIT